VVMARWGSEPLLRPREGAWEGRISQPPATLFDEPVRVRIVGASGAFDDVRVDHRGALSAAPTYLVTSRDASQCATGVGRRVAIARVEGPWPVGGRWWAEERPRAYMRALLEDGRDILLVWQEGQWAMEGLAQ
ncbi:MAG: DNA polymerase Y family protein, partial [Actinomyces sp.]|nr:DNA polymerase Y family protein [Actinomyces sp.]